VYWFRKPLRLGLGFRGIGNFVAASVRNVRVKVRVPSYYEGISLLYLLWNTVTLGLGFHWISKPCSKECHGEIPFEG
jgi:hypothetical protein